MVAKNSNYFPYFAAISVNLLSVSTGTGFSWTSPSLPKLGSSDPEINPLGAPLTLFEESCIASLFPIAAIVGSLASGIAVEYLGRKKTLLLFGLPMVTCYVMIAFAKTVQMIYVARFLIGLGGGAVLVVLPSYVVEISEDKNRGILGGVMGIAVASGHTFNYVVGPFVSMRVFSFLQLIPLVIFYLTFLPFVPESPYYLLSVGKKPLALEALKKLRSQSISAVEEELSYIQERVEDSRTKKADSRNFYKSKAFLRGLLVCCGLVIVQQFGGIGAMLSYMQDIFDAGGKSIPAELAPIPVAIVQLVANFVIVSLVDRLGRILSASGMSVSLLALGTFFYLKTNKYNVDYILWLPISCMIFYFIAFNIGFSILPWTMSSELFSPETKSLGSSISICVCLVTTCLVTMFFPYMAVALDMSGCFWVFSAAPLLSIIFIVFIVPETKGKSIVEIQSILGGRYQEIVQK